MDLTVILTGIGFMTIISFVCGLVLMASTIIIDKCEIVGKFFLLLAYMSFMMSLPVSLAASLIFSFFNRRLARSLEKEHRKEIMKYIDREIEYREKIEKYSQRLFDKEE
jgi:membrane protein implicated in regulation of membrane protease activity